jgi:hypothetical protein
LIGYVFYVLNWSCKLDYLFFTICLHFDLCHICKFYNSILKENKIIYLFPCPDKQQDSNLAKVYTFKKRNANFENIWKICYWEKSKSHIE